MAPRVFTFRRTLVQTRQRGHTAVRSTCYRFGLAGESAFPAKDGGFAADYTNRRGIGATGCALPALADPSWKDPLIWAARIEAVDYRKNSRQCRDDVLGLPREMVQAGLAEQAVADYAQKIAAKWKTPVHWVIHDVDGPNPHAHVIYAGRQLAEPARFAKNRDREQDHQTKPARGRIPAQTSLTDLHSEFWIKAAAAHGFRLDFTPVGARTQAHVGPRAWAIEKQAITDETAAAIGEAVADLDPHERLTPEQIRNAAAAATENLTVTEALALDREPVTEQMQNCPKPAAPAAKELEIAPPPPTIAATGPIPIDREPPVEADVQMPPPVLTAVADQPLPEPAPALAAPLPPPAPVLADTPSLGRPTPAMAPERPIPELPSPALAAPLPPPAAVLAGTPSLGRPAPAIAPDPPIPELPSPALAAALPPPAPVLADTPPLGRPAPAMAPDPPIPELPSPALAAPLPPPAPVLADTPPLGRPAPAIAPDRTVPPPVPATTAERVVKKPPAPAIAPALRYPAPMLAGDLSFERGPRPATEPETGLSPPPPAIAPALPEPGHITEKKRRKAARDLAEFKAGAAEAAQRQAKTAAYKHLQEALSEEGVEAAGIDIIKSDAGDASAHPYIQGLGHQTNRLVVDELRQHTEPFLVPARHRRKADMRGRQYTRWLDAIEGAISRWRTWWSGGRLLAKAASASIIPRLIEAAWPTHWQEEQIAKQKYAEEQASKRARRESNNRAADRLKQQLRAQPSSHRGRKPDGQKYGE